MKQISKTNILLSLEKIQNNEISCLSAKSEKADHRAALVFTVE